MDPESLTRHSKFLSLVLRHKPGLIGLKPDSAGWVPVDALLAALAAHGKALDRESLNEVVARNSKKRFAFNADGTQIRASQGHSIDVELGLQAQVPPDVLYHGTVEAAMAAILREGLTRQQRHHVHLSADIATARQVGSRRGKAVIIEVNARQMHASGELFYVTDNGVWLVDRVPREALRRLD